MYNNVYINYPTVDTLTNSSRVTPNQPRIEKVHIPRTYEDWVKQNELNKRFENLNTYTGLVEDKHLHM